MRPGLCPAPRLQVVRPPDSPAPLVCSSFDQHAGHPPASLRQNLAEQLGITPKSVQVWFQNRRQKLRALGSGPPKRYPETGSKVPGANGSSGVPADEDGALAGPGSQTPPDAASAPAPVRPLQPTEALLPSAQPSQRVSVDMCTSRMGSVPQHLVRELASISSAEQAKAPPAHPALRPPSSRHVRTPSQELAVLAQHLAKRKIATLAQIAHEQQQSARDSPNSPTQQRPRLPPVKHHAAGASAPSMAESAEWMALPSSRVCTQRVLQGPLPAASGEFVAAKRPKLGPNGSPAAEDSVSDSDSADTAQPNALAGGALDGLQLLSDMASHMPA